MLSHMIRGAQRDVQSSGFLDQPVVIRRSRYKIIMIFRWTSRKVTLVRDIFAALFCIV